MLKTQEAHGEAHHVDGFYNVRRPVATLLVRLDFVDDHVVLLLTIRWNVERGEEHLATILHASEEIDYVILHLVDTLLLLHAIRDALNLEDVIPKGVGNLDVILYEHRIT